MARTFWRSDTILDWGAVFAHESCIAGLRSNSSSTQLPCFGSREGQCRLWGSRCTCWTCHHYDSGRCEMAYTALNTALDPSVRGQGATCIRFDVHGAWWWSRLAALQWANGLLRTFNLPVILWLTSSLLAGLRCGPWNQTVRKIVAVVVCGGIST